jgi:protein SCO1/2
MLTLAPAGSAAPLRCGFPWQACKPHADPTSSVTPPAASSTLSDVTFPRLLRSTTLLLVLAAACSRGPKARQYPLEGQIIGTAPDRLEFTINHKDIPNFMPGMTMVYHVKDRKELDGLTGGDLVTGTLVVAGTDFYVTGLRKTGHAELPPSAHPVKALDVMSPGDVVPDDELIDQSGAAHKLSDWRGKAVAVTFIYTRCPLPDFCPLMDRHFAEIQRAVASTPALRGRVHLVSISFDPTHDTPSVLRAHASGLKADPAVWSFLTGTPEAVAHVAERFGVSTIDEKDAAQTITHNLRTAVIDPTGTLTTVYSGNEWTVDQMIDALTHALGKS